MRKLFKLKKQLRELQNGLLYINNSAIYIDLEQIPFINLKAEAVKIRKRLRWIQAFFAFHDLYVIPINLFNTDTSLVELNGIKYPLRSEFMPKATYEIAIMLINDGLDIDSAYEAAWKLEL